jgi:PAS domain S-box-containing protein
LDYSLPQFDAPRALQLVEKSGLAIPVIIVSGSINEEVAVECMRLGAADYLLKDRLARLGDAVRQAIQTKTLREENLKSQKALRESEYRFRSVAETAIDAVVILDVEGRIEYWNQAAQRMFGREIDEAIGRRLTSFIRRKVSSGEQPADLGLSAGATLPGKPIPLIGLRRDGKQFPIELSLSRWDAEGEKHFSAMIRDMTEPLETQRRVQQQERLASIGQLAAGIAHDFKNLLGAIILQSELVLGSLELSRRDEERVRLILGQAERGTYLIRQILDFSHRAIMEPQKVDLVPFFVDLQKLVAPGIKRSVRMSFESEAGDHVVTADPTRLQQVFMNLALNAQDAMPDGGDLRFVVESFRIGPGDPTPIHDMGQGGWVRIRVSDTGIGISSDDLPHIFDPFFTTKPAGEGTGLGLAQVYGIVKQHGGHIDVTSRQGEGTEFGIYLPAPADEASSADGARTPVDGSGHGEVVLIVDDDAAFRGALATTLESLGYDTIVAGDGRQALEIIEANAKKLDVVLTDLVMPGVGGADLFDRIQKRHPQIPLLLMSGYPLGSDTHQLLEEGSVVWLQKPLTEATLARTLRQVIDRKK